MKVASSDVMKSSLKYSVLLSSPPLLPSSLPPSPLSLDPSCVSQVCVGPRRVGGAERRQLVTCILCQEEQEVRGHGRAMVLAAFVQRSTVLSKNRRRNLPDPGGPSLNVTSSEQRPIRVDER